MGWVIVTLIAAAAQTARNATQAGLTARLGTLGATQVRFLFGLPFAVLILSGVALAQGRLPPLPGARTLGFALAGALSQIGATALMLSAMRTQSFAVTTAWIKTEPVLIALGGAVVLGDMLSGPALLAIAVATLGVIVTGIAPGQALRAGLAPAATGLGAAALFGLSALGFRGAILALPEADATLRAATILVLSLTIQSVALALWLSRFHPGTMAASLRLWRPSLRAGALGAGASLFWFIGFALTSAANIRTLALVEVLMAQGVGWALRGQRPTLRQAAGMALIVTGVALLIRAQAVSSA